MAYKVLLVVALLAATGNSRECIPRQFDYDSIVCVCNATYCDETIDLQPVVPEEGQFYWYVSSKEGLRMSPSKGQFGKCGGYSDATLVLDRSKTYQTIFGFGGAFTDAAGLNIKKLSPEAQDQLIRAYFDPKTGSRYTLGRVPIAGTDFSTKPYTYDDYSGDVTLKHFELAKEDYDFKIPLMQRALKLNPEMKFFAAAWTAPPWMKTNDRYNRLGFLKLDNYQIYTDYLIKFLDEYKKHGLNMWSISTGNEPSDGLMPFFPFNCMAWTPELMTKWVTENLGPTLAKSAHNETLIMALDDQRFLLPWFMEKVFANEEARRYIAGTATHWYWDRFISPQRLDQTHDEFPDKFLMMTEACAGSDFWDHPKVKLGSWSRGERYALSLIETLNHWVIGWVDWNLALDKTGGPNWVRNYVDSPIIVNPETNEFFKQPMFYALKHFSRFISRGSQRISITDTLNVKSVAFVTPNKTTVVVLYNSNSVPSSLTINDLQKGTICLELPPYSIHTVIYGQ